jgi:DnaJ family protein C protein 17
MATDDLKSQALNSSQDFYALLEVNEGASESEIRRAYRKTALKYHPDKVGANQEALDKFHLLQIAYDVLSDQSVKELYDNARRARQAKAERDKAYEGRRKWMKEDLERRESGAFKRKREEVDAEEEFERELRRLAEDGKRRRKEREEMLRKEAHEMEEQEQKNEDGVSEEHANGTTNGKGEVEEIDRSITLRFPQNESTRHIDKAELVRRFERFGPIEEVIIREKKIKAEGQKHRQPYLTAVLAFKSVVGAHAAVTDFPQASKSDTEAFGVFEAVSWAAGHPPAFIPAARPSTSTSDASPEAPATPVRKPQPRFSKFTEQFTPVQNGNPKGADGLRKVPSFGSFKGTPARGPGSPSLDEITMIRLKNAERRRLEEKIRREEAEAERIEGAGEDGAAAE